MSKIIKILFLFFLLITMSSCKIGKIGDLGTDRIIPQKDMHMHGPGTVPHNHSHTHKGDHVHKYPCDYKLAKYPSTKSCGIKYEHMHGPDSKPHAHFTTEKGHGTGFQCQYQGKGKVYESNKDCGLHTHKHLHGGLTVTPDDLHGHKTEGGHEHHHKHTGEHAHNTTENFCFTNKGTFRAPIPCLPKHEHNHMHNSSEAPHSHKHDHKKEHAHANMLAFCVGTGNDHRYYLAPNGKCSFKHKHVIMVGYGLKPIVTEHTHKKDITTLSKKAHPFTCTYEGKTYQSSDTCNKPHTHEHSHYDKNTRKQFKHEHEHIVSFRKFHHPRKEDEEFK